MKLLTLNNDMNPILNSFVLGLKAINNEKLENKILILKASKEILLTIKINQGFKMVLVPPHDKIKVPLLCSIFYDCDNSPLVIPTPLFNTIETQDLIKLIESKKIDLHCFDENNREFFGIECDIELIDFDTKISTNFNLQPYENDLLKFSIYDIEPSFILQENSFVNIKFAKNNKIDDLIIFDATLSCHNYHGAIGVNQFGRGIGVSKLDIEEPGEFQERDAALFLSKIYSQDHIYINPMTDQTLLKDRREICDILIISNDDVIIIQAKDSPNTEQILRQSLERKISNSKSHIKKAIAQMKGAVKKIKEKETISFYTDDEKHSIDMSKKKIYGIILIKEYFPENYIFSKESLIAIYEKTSVPCIIIDMNDLNSFTYNLDAKSFSQIINDIFKMRYDEKNVQIRLI